MNNAPCWEICHKYVHMQMPSKFKINCTLYTADFSIYFSILGETFFYLLDYVTRLSEKLGFQKKKKKKEKKGFISYC